MDYTTLKMLRFCAPGIIFLILGSYLGYITGLWEGHWPDDLKKQLVTFNVLVIGGVYYLTPLRDWSNNLFLKKINTNLRKKLVEISSFNDDEKVFTWDAIDSVFYHILDNDKSLSTKVKQVYFNGFILTTLADIRALCALFLITSLIFAGLDIKNSLLAAFSYFILIIYTVIGSFFTTTKHKKLGDKQLNIISLFHQNTLNEKLGEISDRATSKSG